MVMNESEALRWVTRQWQRLNGKDEISGVYLAVCLLSATVSSVFVVPYVLKFFVTFFLYLS